MLPSKLDDTPLINPLYGLRGMVLAAALAVAAAMLPSQSEVIRSFCEGLPFGLLIGLTIISFSIKSVDLLDTSQPSGIHDLRIRQAIRTLTC
jgi:hypothetical protein